MSIDKYPGVGARLEQLLKAAGYWNPAKDRPDVIRFAREQEIRKEFVYSWLQGRIPGNRHLAHLAKALSTCRAYILFGDEGVREAIDFARRRRRTRQAAEQRRSTVARR